jgi:hypothetical protein
VHGAACALQSTSSPLRRLRTSIRRSAAFAVACQCVRDARKTLSQRIKRRSRHAGECERGGGRCCRGNLEQRGDNRGTSTRIGDTEPSIAGRAACSDWGATAAASAKRTLWNAMYCCHRSSMSCCLAAASANLSLNNSSRGT